MEILKSKLCPFNISRLLNQYDVRYLPRVDYYVDDRSLSRSPSKRDSSVKTMSYIGSAATLRNEIMRIQEEVVAEEKSSEERKSYKRAGTQMSSFNIRAYDDMNSLEDEEFKLTEEPTIAINASTEYLTRNSKVMTDLNNAHLGSKTSEASE